MQPNRGQIDPTIGRGNALFLGDIANGKSRAEIEQNFRAGRYEDLHQGLAQQAMKDAGMGLTTTTPMSKGDAG